MPTEKWEKDKNQAIEEKNTHFYMFILKMGN